MSSRSVGRPAARFIRIRSSSETIATSLPSRSTTRARSRISSNPRAPFGSLRMWIWPWRVSSGGMTAAMARRSGSPTGISALLRPLVPGTGVQLRERRAEPVQVLRAWIWSQVEVHRRAPVTMHLGGHAPDYEVVDTVASQNGDQLAKVEGTIDLLTGLVLARSRA